MDTIELINWITKLIKENNIHTFYVSRPWKKLRQEVINQSNKECQLCKAKGKVSTATTVHHIKHLKDHPELALTRSNLMAVCKECHNELHPEKHRYKFKEVINEERW
ncbi:MAG: HNH endonuclease [Clostridium sp.]